MRIDQITPLLKYGDAISHTVLYLQERLKNTGVVSNIYTPAGKREIGGRSLDFHEFQEPGDQIIYHMFMDSRAAQFVAGLKARQKIMVYHGIVPPEYFSDYPSRTHQLRGREELKFLKNYMDLVITNYKYHERELHELGFERTLVLPPLVNLGDYDREPDPHLLKLYRDDHVNLLFAGRISPNNKQEDIISVFNYYHKRVNQKSRLFLVGEYRGNPGYYRKLLALVNELQIKNVFITGRVSFVQLLAYYQVSHVFLSMSEYEGTCTSLIEAMYLKVPVIAYHFGVAAEVLGEAGRLIRDKDIRETARLVDRLATGGQARERVLERQSARVAGFHPDQVFPKYQEVLNL
jgi:glycosyltransferase involved in cell wall biosynthesis